MTLTYIGLYSFFVGLLFGVIIGLTFAALIKIDNKEKYEED